MTNRAAPMSKRDDAGTPGCARRGRLGIAALFSRLLAPVPLLAPAVPSLLAAILTLLAVVPARAAGSAVCNITATPLVFSVYQPSGTVPTDITATITVTCTATGSATVPIDGSIALAGWAAPYGRQLTSGANTLRYHTYADPARTVYWGDGTGRGVTQTVSGVVAPGTPLQQVFTVYGRILARQSSAHVGSYTDQITAILTY